MTWTTRPGFDGVGNRESTPVFVFGDGKNINAALFSSKRLEEDIYIYIGGGDSEVDRENRKHRAYLPWQDAWLKARDTHLERDFRCRSSFSRCSRWVWSSHMPLIPFSTLAEICLSGKFRRGDPTHITRSIRSESVKDQCSPDSCHPNSLISSRVSRRKLYNTGTLMMTEGRTLYEGHDRKTPDYRLMLNSWSKHKHGDFFTKYTYIQKDHSQIPGYLSHAAIGVYSASWSSFISLFRFHRRGSILMSNLSNHIIVIESYVEHACKSLCFWAAPYNLNVRTQNSKDHIMVPLKFDTVLE